MTLSPKWKAVRGDEIGEDHIWWFHRTFRQRAPGGFAKSLQAGYRSRRRELGSDGTGKLNSQSEDDDTDLRLLALVLLGLLEIPDVRGRLNLNRAAQEAVLLLHGWERWDEVFFRALLNRAADPANRDLKRSYADSLTPREVSMVKAYWRVYDFLRCLDRRVRRQPPAFSKSRVAEAQATLRGHIVWLRSSPDMRATLRAERALLIHGRHGKEDQACVQARHAPRNIEAERVLEEEAKAWPPSPVRP